MGYDHRLSLASQLHRDRYGHAACCLTLGVSKIWPADFRHGDKYVLKCRPEVKKDLFCFLMFFMPATLAQRNASETQRTVTASIFNLYFLTHMLLDRWFPPADRAGYAIVTLWIWTSKLDMRRWRRHLLFRCRQDIFEELLTWTWSVWCALLRISWFS